MINSRIEIISKLGEGRSKVFLCSLIDYPRNQFAIKILSNDRDQDEKKSFREEYQLLTELKHPNIISANEFGTVLSIDSVDEKHEISKNDLFFILEYFDGMDIDKYNLLDDEDKYLEIIWQIISVLYYLHQSNYIYYDLKAENILVNDINGNPQIMFIDFGMAKFIPSIEEFYVRGTTEYIAPEILQKHPTDHRADLYSLGILLYKLTYGKFPFLGDSELEIFKAQVEQEFEFPDTNFPKNIVKSIKKLLAKNPSERYFNTLHMIDDLKFEIDLENKSVWKEKFRFVARSEEFHELQKYISSPPEGKVFNIIGYEGIGKSFFLKEFSKTSNRIIFISYSDYSGNFKFWNYLVYKIIFNDFIFINTDGSIVQYVLSHLSDEFDVLLDDLKSVSSRLAISNEFAIIIDDFNLLDELSREILSDLIPIFQANNIHVIISEDKNVERHSEFIHNLQTIELKALTDENIVKLVEDSFTAFFPREELSKLILNYADHSPGNIGSFISDLIIAEILDYNSEGPVINADEDLIDELSKNMDKFYDRRIKSLSDDELKLAQILSAINISLDSYLLQEITGWDKQKYKSNYNTLSDRNIVNRVYSNSLPQISSNGLKKYIYDSIKDKATFHSDLGNILSEYESEIELTELSRHYQLGEKFDESYKILEKEIRRAKRVSAYSYSKQLLVKVLEFPLESRLISDLTLDMANVCILLGQYQESADILATINTNNFDQQNKIEFGIAQARSLSGIGESGKALDLYNKIILEEIDEKLKNNILVEIADIKLDMGEYDEAKSICNNSISMTNIEPDYLGKSYNLLGLVEIYENNNPRGAISFFNSALGIYKKANMQLKVAGMEVNIGNIYNMLHEASSAEKHWKKALQINQSIGNLEQEAKVLLNYGILYFDKLEFEEAIKQYNRAYSIFMGIGNKEGLGLVLTNLGEVNSIVCDYSKAIDKLLKAQEIFREIKNKNEESEAIFFLAKLYFDIGYFDAFGEILLSYEKKLGTDNTNERGSINLAYLKKMYSIIVDNKDTDVAQLSDISEKYLKQEDTFNYISSKLFLSESLVKQTKFEDALKTLNEEKFQKHIEHNKYFLAYSYYILGLISKGYDDSNLEPEINYFNMALDMISEESITELTWKILYEIGIYYHSRGNILKAKNYIIYSKSLINFISENIISNKLKSIYLAHPERMFKLSELTKLEKKLA